MEKLKQKEYEEKIIQIDRISRTVAGGRRMRFRAVVVVGDKKGKVGLGVAKGNDTSLAVTKATRQAKKNFIQVKLIDGAISRQVIGKFANARVLLKPVRRGRLIVAGGVVRAIAEAAGIGNISAKMLGPANKINNAKATILALEKVSQ